MNSNQSFVEFGSLEKELESKCAEINQLKLEVEKHKLLIDQPTSQPQESQLLNSPMVYDQQILSLREKLTHASNTYVEREKRFETSYKDMELKLRRAIASRDQILKLRESESTNQQQLIQQLQNALETSEKENYRNKEQVIKLEISMDKNSKQSISLNEKISSIENKLVHIYKSNKMKTNLLKGFELDYSDITSNMESLLTHVFMKYNVLLETTRRPCQHCIKLNEKNEKKENYKEELLKVNEKKDDLINELDDKNKEVLSVKENLERVKSEFMNEIKTLKSLLAESKSTHSEEKLQLTLKNNEMNIENKSMKGDLESNKETKACMESTVQSLTQEYKTLCDDVANKNIVLSRLESENSVLAKEKHNYEEMLFSEKEKNKLLKSQFEKEMMLLNEKFKNEEHIRNEKLKDIKIQYEVLVKHNKESANKITEANHVIEKLRNEQQERKDSNTEHLKQVIQTLKSKLATNQEDVTALELSYIQKNKDLKSLNEHLAKQKEIEKNALLRKCESLSLKLNQIHKCESDLSKSLEELKTSLQMANARNIEHEKTNSELSVALKASNFKFDFIQQEFNKTDNIVKEKNNEIYKLKKEIKAIAKKLKDKHDRILEFEQISLSSNDAITELKNKLLNYETNCTTLHNEFTNLQTKYQQIENEKHVMQEKLLKKEESKEIEVTKLLKCLHGSKDDIIFLKRLLKSHKQNDNQAFETATNNQQVVTKQRSQIDALKSKIAFLTDAFEVSEKTRVEFQQQHEVEKKCLTNQHDDHIAELKSDINELKLQLEDANNESSRLHKLLQKVALKYDEVYDLVCKQEHLNKRSGQQVVFNNEKIKISKSNDFSIKCMLQDVQHVLSSTLKTINNKQNKTSGDEDAFSNSQKLEEYIEKYETEIPSISSVLETETRVNNPKDLVKLTQEETNATEFNDVFKSDSTVMLLNTMKDSVVDLNSERDDEISIKKSDSNPVHRLQEKLNNILQMGADLETNNIELVSLMKKHSTKIGKAKGAVT